MRSDRGRTSVDLATGLLGAGKTTFIKGYIDFLQRNNITCAVIENEFGLAGVDTALLSCAGVRITQLVGGCICCGLKVGFVDALIELLKDYERVVVEPSGVFTLGDFYEVMDAPAVRERCAVGAVVTVVDGSARVDEGDRELFDAQIIGTGIVVANRCGTWDWDGPAIDSPAINVPVIIDNGLTDEDYMRIMESAPVTHNGVKADIDHASIYQSCSFAPPDALSPEEIRSAAQSIFTTSACGDVLRIKGSAAGCAVNATKNHVTVTQDTTGSVPTMLNVIGRRLNRSEIRRILLPRQV